MLLLLLAHFWQVAAKALMTMAETPLTLLLKKEVRGMPITLTIHIFGLVITIKVKSENRHSGQFP